MDPARKAPRDEGGTPETNLWQRARAGDAQAREELTRRHLPLVHHVAARFHSAAGDREDLVQVGSVGLLKAIDGFDPRRGLRFSTYAVPVIGGEILRYLRDNAPVHLPRAARRLARRAATARERLTQRLGREPSLPELAGALGVAAERLLPAIEAHRLPASLEQPLAGGEDDPLRLLDRLAAGNDAAAAGERRALLEDLLGRLDVQSRRVVVLRYFDDLTQEEIGRRLGLSQSHVSRLLGRALRRMRDWSAGSY